MGFDDAHHSQDNKAGQEATWETPSDEGTRATPAIAASSGNQISDTLSLVASPEMGERSCRARDDQKPPSSISRAQPICTSCLRRMRQCPIRIGHAEP